MSIDYSKPLTDLQDEFLAAVKDLPSSVSQQIVPMLNLSENDCLNVYRRGYFARLTEALGETFEATWWVLGDDDFLALANEYIRRSPSIDFDLSMHGKHFPQFLESQLQEIEIPFLADLARFEWAFHEIFHSTNVESTTSTLPNQPISSGSRLALSPSAQLLESEYDIYQIWNKRSTKIDTLSNLAINKTTKVLIYKKSGSILVNQLQIDEYIILKALSDSGDVEKSIEVLVRESPQISPNRVQDIFALIASMGILTLRESLADGIS